MAILVYRKDENRYASAYHLAYRLIAPDNSDTPKLDTDEDLREAVRNKTRNEFSKPKIGLFIFYLALYLGYIAMIYIHGMEEDEEKDIHKY